MDELNEYLECTCGRCDDGICRCSEWEEVPLQDATDGVLDYDCEDVVVDNNDWE